MARKASTFRIDTDLQTALKTLSKIAHRPMNRLVNEAVKLYLEQRGQEVERDLEASLANLRAYRQRDPNFEQAIDAFVEAEAKLKDPIEGRPEKGGVRQRRQTQRRPNARLGRR